MDADRVILNSLLEVAAIAEVCIERRLLLPALVLLYSGIDSMGWLVSTDAPVTVRDRFTAWVDHYMLPEKPLPCSSLDLYGARCGILHTLTPDSDLSAAGRARPIYYAWGKVSDQDIAAVAAAGPIANFAFLRVEDLAEAFRLGVAKTIEAGATDRALAGIILSKSGRYLSFIPSHTLFGRPPSDGSGTCD